MEKRTDGRKFIVLPSGIVKKPTIHIAGQDLYVNDIVKISGDVAIPVYEWPEKEEFYGVVLCYCKKGEKVFVAAR